MLWVAMDYSTPAGLEINFFVRKPAGDQWKKNWSPDREFWLPTYFTYNSHMHMILFVTLHARQKSHH